VENLAPTGIRSPDRPVRRQSLYRLRFSAVGEVPTSNLGVKVTQKLEFNIRDMVVYLITSCIDRNNGYINEFVMFVGL
jgi:hypothetical protein